MDNLWIRAEKQWLSISGGARRSSVEIGSILHGEPMKLFLVPASARSPRLV